MSSCAAAGPLDASASQGDLFLLLPPALFFLVFSTVPVDTRLRCREVCRKWRALLGDPRLWSACDLSVATGGITANRSFGLLLAASRQARGQLQQLNIDFWDGPLEGFASAVDSVLSENRCSLTLLSGRGLYCHQHRIAQVVALAPSLTTFRCWVKCWRNKDTVKLLGKQPPFGPVEVEDLSLESFDFSDDDEEWEEVGKLEDTSRWADVLLAAKSQPSITSLTLKQHNFDPDQNNNARLLGSELLTDFTVSREISRLVFLDCKLHPTILSAVAATLRDGALDELCLVDCKPWHSLWHSEEAASFATELQLNKTLLSLKLSHVNLFKKLYYFYREPPAYDGASAILLACVGHPTLKELYLSENPIAFEKSAVAQDARERRNQVGEALIRILAASSVLEVLDISKCKLGEEVTAPVFATLHSNVRLQELFCSGNELSTSFAEARIFPALRENESLKYFHLDGVVLPKDLRASKPGLRIAGDGVSLDQHLPHTWSARRDKILAKLCEASSTIETLSVPDIRGNKLAVEELASALYVNSSVRRLHFSGQGLDASRTRALVSACSNRLVRLNLERNPLGDEGALALAEVLHANTTLEQIRLESCDLGGYGIAALSGLFATLPGLTVVHLDDNEFGAAGAAALSTLLECPASRIDHLTLSNCLLGDDGVASIAKGLRNSRLSYITLENNSISAGGTEVLASALTCSDFLSHLNLSRNSIGDAGAIALAVAITRTSCLRQLDVSRNSIGDTGAQAFAQALAHSDSVRHLNLSRNGISDASAEDFAHCLKSNAKLEELNLQGNMFGDDGCRVLAQGVDSNENQHLRVRISDNRLSEDVHHLHCVRLWVHHLDDPF